MYINNVLLLSLLNLRNNGTYLFQLVDCCSNSLKKRYVIILHIEFAG